jgi:hypothetical protein
VVLSCGVGGAFRDDSQLSFKVFCSANLPVSGLNRSGCQKTGATSTAGPAGPLQLRSSAATMTVAVSGPGKF